MTEFTAEFFKGNRQRLRAAADDGLIVVTGNGLLQRNSDNNYRFRQDSSFWYLTGVSIPDVLLVIDGELEYLITPELSPHEAVFGESRNLNNLLVQSGVDEVLEYQEGWQRLSKRVGQGDGRVRTLAAVPAYSEHYGFYTNPARAVLEKRLREINPKIEIGDLRDQLMRLRSVKQPAELHAIRAAIDVTAATLTQLRRKLPSLEYEYQVEAELSYGFRSAGADGHAFDPIVASGQSSAVLHYQQNNAPLQDWILLDVGAEMNMYAADITRVYARQPPSDRHRAVYEAVYDVQQFAKSLIKPGALLRDNEKRINELMAQKLQLLQLITSTGRDAIGKYYPHSTSHSLGLDVHDAMDYDLPLEAGMVLTIEPGIYIPEEGIGVRIEDDVLVTKTGCEVLSADLPSSPKDILG